MYNTPRIRNAIAYCIQLPDHFSKPVIDHQRVVDQSPCNPEVCVCCYSVTRSSAVVEEEISPTGSAVKSHLAPPHGERVVVFPKRTSRRQSNRRSAEMGLRRRCCRGCCCGCFRPFRRPPRGRHCLGFLGGVFLLQGFVVAEDGGTSWGFVVATA